MKTIAIALALAMTGIAHADTAVDQAAAAALQEIAAMPAAVDVEFVALLYQAPDGTVGVTDYQGQAAEGKSSWTGRVPGKIVGIVHNHPALQYREPRRAMTFSQTDVKSAIAFDVPIYLVVVNDDGSRQYRKYVPRKSHVGMTRLGDEFPVQ